MLELWSREEKYPSLPYTLHMNRHPSVIESEALNNALRALPEKQRTGILLDFWQDFAVLAVSIGDPAMDDSVFMPYRR